MDATLVDLIPEVLRRRSVRSVYQPVVVLDSGAVVAYEALARGPVGSAVEWPDRLFLAAAVAGATAELDQLCLTTAIESASGRLPTWCPLFVNVEPVTLSSELVRRTAPIAVAGDRPLVLEVTERAITTSPAMLLAGVQAAREHGWSIALDDVGVEPGSLALLPIIRPDVVKLDMGLVRERPDRELGRTMAAVMAYAERSGATILAEGIETEAHLERAVSLGATLGQGYLFGRPGPLDEVVHDEAPHGGAEHDAPPPDVLRISAGQARRLALSPFDAVVAAGHRSRVARKSVLLQISHHLEEQALADPGAPLLLSAFQHARHFTPATSRRYEALAAKCAVTAALGTDMAPEPVPGVRGAVLLAGDPLEGEWSVVVLGSHYAGALLGKDVGGDSSDADRRFHYVVTHDRAAVELAAESLLRRVAPAL